MEPVLNRENSDQDFLGMNRLNLNLNKGMSLKGN
jgi:hypothetical protein